MSSSHGKFVWYELLTIGAEAAQGFYGSVVGWSMKNSGMSDVRYTLLSAGDIQVGGLMEIPAPALEAGARPLWVGYIAVDDVDAYVAKVEAEGGTIHRAAADIPGVGRFAMVADPQGAPFVLFKGEGPAQPQPPAPDTQGHIGWHELFAQHREGAWGFYSKLFGWTKAEAFDMGPMGIYQLFAIDGKTKGAMMNKPEQMPRPFWLYYFNVDAADAAAARVTAAGGRILMGPHEVPTGQWILQCMDPQGAMFALLAPRR